MASLLVIGGSGFFGKSILDAFSRGLLNSWDIESIAIYARNAAQLRTSFPGLIGPAIQLINGNIATALDVPKADYVIHAAASTDAKNYLERGDEEKKNIQAGTYNYCTLAEKFHVNSRIVYCSSGAIYGQQPKLLPYLSEDMDLGDIGEMDPSKRDYAAAKRDAEGAIEGLALQGLNVSIARCFAFVGQYLPRDQHFAIGNFIQDGLNGGPINVSATFPVFRSYMYADDLVRWLMTICHSSNLACPIYNVGSDEEISITDLAGLIGRHFNCRVNAKEAFGSKVDRYIPSTAKAKKNLGLDLSFDLPSAIKRTIELIYAKEPHA